MTDQMILTPYFLDEAWPGLTEVAGDDWALIRLALPPAERQRRMVALYQPLREAVSDALRAGRRPVSVAGDCCATLPVLAALRAAGLLPTLLWLDAHGDFNTWETTPSGFLGGMPLAMMVGLGELTLAQRAGLVPFPAEQVILCDGRDLDPGEQDNLAATAVRHLPDPAALLDLPLPDGPLYVHFDVDIVDPAELPAVGYPAAGGPSAALLGQVFDRLARSGRVAAVSVSTWNPALDGDGRSQTVALDLLDRLLAGT